MELSVASFDHVKDDQFMSSKIMILPTSPPILAQHSIHPASRCSIISTSEFRNNSSPVQSSSLINSEINLIILMMI